MRNIFKLGLVVVLICFTTQVNGQVRFGIKTGMNLGSISQKMADEDEEEIETQVLFAYHFGASVVFGLGDDFSLETGLIYTNKGFQTDINNDLPPGLMIEGYDRYIFTYLEVPVNLVYKIDKVQIMAGPYLAMGISGKNKYDITISYAGDSSTEADEYSFKPVFGEVMDGDLADEEDAFYALDYGLNLGVGYHLGSVLISTGYSFSMGNILPLYEGDTDDRNDNKISPNVFSLSLSYYFGL
jgi:hypothetical protein